MSVKTTIKVVLRKAGDAWEATKEYSLLDYVIVDGQTQYVCRKVDAATGVNKGHKLTESEWWEKCADAGEMAETLESVVTELVTSADEAVDAANNAANSATKVDAKVDDHNVVVTDGEGNTATYPTASLTDVQVDGESVVADGVASVPKTPKVWANVMAVKDCAIKVDGKIVELPAYENVVIEDFKSVDAFLSKDYYSPKWIKKADIHYNGLAKFSWAGGHGGYTKDAPTSYQEYGFGTTSLNVSGLNTENTTSLNGFARSCSSLTSIDVSGFDTKNVTTMYCMFYNCSSLTSIDVSGFDTKNVTTMYCMFFGCSSLTSIDVSGFDTKNVTTMYCMFSGCSSLTSIDVSGFDTKNVTTMQSMFYNCSSLTSIDVSGFDTKNVTTMYCMFSGCSSLTSIDVSGFDTKNVTTMHCMFFYGKNLTNIIFGPNWGTQTSTAAAALTLDLSLVGYGKSYNLTDATWASMLTMYDRATAGLTNMTIKLHKNHNVPDGWAAKMTERGYTISY